MLKQIGRAIGWLGGFSFFDFCHLIYAVTSVLRITVAWSTVVRICLAVVLEPSDCGMRFIWIMVVWSISGDYGSQRIEYSIYFAFRLTWCLLYLRLRYVDSL